MKKQRSTHRFPLVIFSGLFFTYAVLLYAYSTGIGGKTSLGDNGGCSCHGSSSSNVNVSITGPDILTVNETANYQVKITGGPAVQGGTDIAVSGAAISPVSSGLKVHSGSGDLTHSSSQDFSGGELVFEFELTAPANPGTVTLAAVGNSVNGTGSTGGDQWNFAPDKLVTIQDAVSIFGDRTFTPDKPQLHQNYPNPFNPQTIIEFDLADSGPASLAVYNSAGSKVRTLADNVFSAGSYRFAWNGRDDSGRLLSSGVYFYHLKTTNFYEVKRMLFIK